MGNDYPNDWDQRRKDVYQRDGYQCQNCGRQGGSTGAELHAHHIVPKSSGGSHKRSNLKTVCAKCHQAIHGDSVAPSAESVPTEDPEHNFEFFTGEYPIAVSPCITLGQELETAVEELEVLDEKLTELLELLDLAVSLDDNERPAEFEDRFQSTSQTVKISIDDLERNLNDIAPEYPSFIGDTYREVVDRVTQSAVEMIALLRDLRGLISSIAGIDDRTPDRSSTASMFAELHVVNLELEEAVQEFVTKCESMFKSIETEVKKYTEHLRSQAYYNFNPTQYSDCPICDASGPEYSISDELSLMSCTSCNTELQQQSMFQFTAIASDKHIEGISIQGDMWKLIDSGRLDDREYIDTVTERSETLGNMTKLLIAALFMLQLGVAVYLAGSPPAVFVGGLLLPFPLAYLCVKFLKFYYHPDR